jgi:hypothetical protein
MTESFADIDGTPVLSGSVFLPRRGAWHATITLDTDQPPSGAVTLSLDAGGTVMRGTVVRAGEAFGRVACIVVGGAGRLALPVAPRHYRNALASDIWGDLVRDAGEAAGGRSDAATLARTLGQWSRLRGTAGALLDTFTRHIGALWRVDRDGSLRLMLPDATDPGSAAGTLLASSPSEAFDVWALDTHDLAPGMVLNGRRVSDVEHCIRDDGPRSKVWYG